LFRSPPHLEAGHQPPQPLPTLHQHHLGAGPGELQSRRCPPYAAPDHDGPSCHRAGSEGLAWPAPTRSRRRYILTSSITARAITRGWAPRARPPVRGEWVTPSSTTAFPERPSFTMSSVLTMAPTLSMWSSSDRK